MQFLPACGDSVGRTRLILTIVFAVNFLAFLLHTLRDGWATAFPLGGTFSGDHYVVISHGIQVSFTPAAYHFSYLHGLVFTIVSLFCIVWLWYLRRKTRDVSDATI
jgi:hypothetical protein